ncbi:MAG: GNAT family N-acetyltransferase [Deltaproteobacteria bacterium]|nr:GNAT family N-acetyltransferase [Deltaproteobacteria bacterium]
MITPRGSTSLVRPTSGQLFYFRPTKLTLCDGTHVTIRSITPEDESRMIDFHQALSQQSVHFRYFAMLSLGFRTRHERLAALCATDRAREIALVADQKRSDGEHEILGVARLIKTPGLDEAEFALLVTDRRQGDGLGTALLKLLVAIGRKAQVRIVGHVLPDNAAMLHVCRNLGFTLHFHPAEGEWAVELDLRPEHLTRGSQAPV